MPRNPGLYLGWLFPFDQELTLIGESPEQIAEAQRELVRIGIDRLAAATGGIDDLADGQTLGSYPVSDFAGLAERDPDQVFVIDARTHGERAGGGVRGSVHIPLHELPARRDEVPAGGEVWVYCGSGYRASVAASMLAAGDDKDRHLVVINDEWANAADAGLPIATDQ